MVDTQLAEAFAGFTVENAESFIRFSMSIDILSLYDRASILSLLDELGMDETRFSE
jgi:hypothetical protein